MHSTIHQTQSKTASLLRRGNLISVLQKMVAACEADGGGVIALLGKPGFGKSVLAHQFISEIDGAIYFDLLDLDDDGKKALELSGIAVVDEIWQLKNAPEVIKTHINKNKGVIIAISCELSEIESLCGDLLKASMEVPHWNSQEDSIYCEGGSQRIEIIPSRERSSLEVSQIKSDKKRSGIVRFQSPDGNTWTGIGRPPKWLTEFELRGISREKFRVDNSPLRPKKQRL